MKLLALVAVLGCHANHGDATKQISPGVYCDRTRGVVHAPHEDPAHGIERCAPDQQCCTTTGEAFQCGDWHASVWTSCLELADANAHP